MEVTAEKTDPLVRATEKHQQRETSYPQITSEPSLIPPSSVTTFTLIHTGCGIGSSSEQESHHQNKTVTICHQSLFVSKFFY